MGNSKFVLISIPKFSLQSKEYTIRIHDRRRMGRKSSNKVKVEEKVFGAKEARFAPDGKSVFVLTEDGSGHHMVGNRTSSNNRSNNQIKVYTIGEDSLNLTAIFKSNSASVQYWDFRKVKMGNTVFFTECYYFKGL